MHVIVYCWLFLSFSSEDASTFNSQSQKVTAKILLSKIILARTLVHVWRFSTWKKSNYSLAGAPINVWISVSARLTATVRDCSRLTATDVIIPKNYSRGVFRVIFVPQKKIRQLPVVFWKRKPRRFYLGVKWVNLVYVSVSPYHIVMVWYGIVPYHTIRYHTSFGSNLSDPFWTGYEPL